MNVLQNLVALYNQLPSDSTYKGVCSGILRNLEEAASGTIYDIAEVTNASRTTIWRMVQKMGYRSFSGFQYELRQAVKKYTYYNRILPAETCVSPERIRDSFLEQTKSIRRLVADHLDMILLDHVADRLSQADKVGFYLPFPNSAICSIQQNLSMTGVGTSYNCLFPEMLQDSKTLSEKSYVFVNTIDHAETMDMTEVFERIKNRGATILGVQSGKSKYKNFMDYNLIDCPTSEIFTSILVIDIFFYTLSEVYRMKYIG